MRRHPCYLSNLLGSRWTLVQSRERSHICILIVLRRLQGNPKMKPNPPLRTTLYMIDLQRSYSCLRGRPTQMHRRLLVTADGFKVAESLVHYLRGTFK